MNKISIQIDAIFIVLTEGRAAAESSPEVARGGQMDGRSVTLSLLLVAVTAGLAAAFVSSSHGLRTSNGELVSLSTSVGSKICELVAFSAARI